MIEALEYSEGIHEGYKNDGRAYGSFYPQDDSCPFCQRELCEVFSSGIIEYDPENKGTSQDIHHSVTAKCCKCGWWTVQHVETADAHDLYAPANWVFFYRGALRKFSLADANIPMDSLRRAIARHPEAIDAISPRKMEELVGAVMTDFWPGTTCKLCGKSGDGGIDLLLGIGDKPFAIQVKHRQDIGKAESVHYVTHFIGALMLGNVPNGIFVTTADHFSRAAERAAAEILERGLVESFQLTARGPFLEMLEATSKNLPDPWRRCIPEVLLENSSRLTPYSIHLRPPN